MKPYQEQYLALLSDAAQAAVPPMRTLEPQDFIDRVREAKRESRQCVEQGTNLLREELFPLLDNILSASREEIDSLSEFADQLMRGQEQKDVGLHYRIHLALLSYARHKNDRNLLIRELYMVGMSLYNMETMLSPNKIRPYSARMRLYFTESASYFDTAYDEIEDAQTRGYIHRSMANVSLSYEGDTPESAQKKLAVNTRSIRILSDPDVRAKTPSLPWDLYLYTCHQQRTTNLAFLRSGRATPEAFAQVLESAQIVHQRQLNAARERGESLQPRWQYAYLAAQYHCGALLLSKLLDGLYALSFSRPDDDFGVQSMFAHLNAPALYMEYAKQLKDARALADVPRRVERMTRRMCVWLMHAPSGDNDEQMMFYLRLFLYAYSEFPGNMPFFEVLQTVFAARHPVAYVRMWIAGRVTRLLCDWAAQDCPQNLAGLPGFLTVQDVIFRHEALLDFAERAGRLYDTGMVHFFNLESKACRGLFEEEETLLRFHARCGYALLSEHPSTAPYADIAHGHHRDFDGRGGFPVDFSLNDSPCGPMICLVAAADMLAAATEEAGSRFRPTKTFDEAVEELFAGEGKRYAPFVVGLLRDEGRRDFLRAELARLNREAYLDLYRRRAQTVEMQESVPPL